MCSLCVCVTRRLIVKDVPSANKAPCSSSLEERASPKLSQSDPHRSPQTRTFSRLLEQESSPLLNDPITSLLLSFSLPIVSA